MSCMGNVENPFNLCQMNAKEEIMSHALAKYFLLQALRIASVYITRIRLHPLMIRLSPVTRHEG